MIALVAILFGLVYGERTLVVVDDLSVKDTHSIFFKSLTGTSPTSLTSPPNFPSIFNFIMLFMHNNCVVQIVAMY